MRFASCKVHFRLPRAAFANICSLKLVRLSLLALLVFPLSASYDPIGTQATDGTTYWCIRRPVKPRFQPRYLGVLGWQFLGGVTTMNSIQNLATKQMRSRIELRPHGAFPNIIREGEL